LSDIGDTVKQLYDNFLLRDLLSSVTPGAIVVVSASLVKFCPSQILDFSRSVPFIAYIPIFGVFYIVGFGIQCLGAEIIRGKRFRLIKFHRCNTDEDFYDELKEFFAKADEKFKLDHERFAVLRQMGGNSALAIFIAGVLLAIRQLKLESFWPFWPFWVLGAIVAISLYVGHLVHVTRQEKWRNAVKEQSDKKTPAESQK